MIDCAHNVRIIYVNALNGNLSYNGKDVPVYGQTPFDTTPQNYVVIGNINEVSDNTNHSFGNNVEVVVDIFSEQYRVNDLGVVDNIASQILNILIPDTQVDGFDDANFEVFPIGRSSSRYLPLQDGDNYVARKIITINNLVNQK
jgi:hypothetical protein